MTTQHHFDALFTDFEKALSGFKESLMLDITSYNASLADTVKSGQMQKFEYCAELSWKVSRSLLQYKYQIIANSPVTVYRELFNQFIIDDGDCSALLTMIKDRNMLSHVYKEEMAEKIYPRLPDHCVLLSSLFQKLKVQK